VEVSDPGETAGVDWQGLNRANWDDRVPIHLASEFYDLAGFRAGRDSLTGERFLRADHAEFVSLGVSENCPGLSAGLPDVGPACSQRQ
jgi:hypothetical protein